uniref:N-acetylgalactosaminide beta-1,3-galactosyltransferase n=1 Tax=Plectus sambesii TaxID=2011161 RepID=A0A914VET3_9BILA
MYSAFLRSCLSALHSSSSWLKLLVLLIGIILGSMLFPSKYVEYVGQPTCWTGLRRPLNSAEIVEQSTANVFHNKVDPVCAAVSSIHKAENQLSAVLYDSKRILCWIMTEKRGKDRQDAILDTWGTRCNMLLFVEGADTDARSDQKEVLFKTVHKIRLHMNDSYENLWEKTKLAFRYIHDNYKGQFDWILKVDDDSYVIMENLRLFLHNKCEEDAHYYGCQYKAGGGYISGGPGYVISAFNLKKLIQSFSMPQCSQSSSGAEDVEIAKCLRLVGITPGDSRDVRRFRFSPFKVENTMFHDSLKSAYNWFWSYSAHKLEEGFECCSDDHISFHYIEPHEMRIMEFSIYYLHPFSRRDGWRRLLEKPRPEN